MPVRGAGAGPPQSARVQGEMWVVNLSWQGGAGKLTRARRRGEAGQGGGGRAGATGLSD